jgi:hypothetical protein
LLQRNLWLHLQIDVSLHLTRLSIITPRALPSYYQAHLIVWLELRTQLRFPLKSYGQAAPSDNMVSPVVSSTRAILHSISPISSRSPCICTRIEATRQRIRQQRRPVSTGSIQQQEMEVDAPAPRWAHTPPAMKGSLTVRKLTNKGGRHDVNKDPRRLDSFYTRLLGPDGPKLLSDETRWLAVTHKSFDHGRRGFNDRLAFIGMFRARAIVAVAHRRQANALLSSRRH